MNDKTKKKTADLEVVQGMFQTFKSSHIGIPNITEAVYYTQSEANAYNALLTGALDSTTPLTAEQAAEYNEAVTGATKEAGDTLSAEEAAAYNATLDGAVTTEDVKTPAVPKKVKDYVDENAVTDVAFDSTTGYVKKTKNGTTSNVVQVVTSGFSITQDDVNGIDILTAIGSATITDDNTNGLDILNF